MFVLDSLEDFFFFREFRWDWIVCLGFIIIILVDLYFINGLLFEMFLKEVLRYFV